MAADGLKAPDHAGYGLWIVKSLILIGLIALALLLWRIRDVFLLAFASVLVAVLLTAAARPIRRWTGISRAWSLAVAGGAILLALVLTGWLIGAQVQNQVAELVRELPRAVGNLEERLGISVSLDQVLSNSSQTAAEPQRTTERAGNGTGGFSLLNDLTTHLLSWSRTLVETVTGLVLVVVAGIYLAASPGPYRRGFVKLFPPSYHQNISGALTASGRGLFLWLQAQLLAMAVVGLLAGIGSWAIGLPAPLALGLFAGLTEFVPIVGPIAGAVPALLLAATQGTGALLWTLALYVGIQQLESNVIAPLLERRMVQIPPALFLFAAVAFGLLFGLIGILLAAPLTVVAFIAINKLYVEGTLDEIPETNVD